MEESKVSQEKQKQQAEFLKRQQVADLESARKAQEGPWAKTDPWKSQTMSLKEIQDMQQKKEAELAAYLAQERKQQDAKQAEALKHVEGSFLFSCFPFL